MKVYEVTIRLRVQIIQIDPTIGSYFRDRQVGFSNVAVPAVRSVGTLTEYQNTNMKLWPILGFVWVVSSSMQNGN